MTWDDIIAFYKQERKADEHLRAIAGKWMHKLSKSLCKDDTFAALPVNLNGWTLVFDLPDSERSIYAFCDQPGRITIYLDHCGDSLETFYGEHRTVEIEDAEAELHQILHSL